MNAKTLLLPLTATLALTAATAWGCPAHAASYDLTTSYGDGGSFIGQVTFNPDESEVEAVTGLLYDYSPTSGFTGYSLDVTKIDTFAGSCSPVYTSVCFSGGVWTNVTGVSGLLSTISEQLACPSMSPATMVTRPDTTAPYRLATSHQSQPSPPPPSPPPGRC